MGLSCGAVCPCRPRQILDSLAEAATTVAETGMPRPPDEPSPIPTSPAAPVTGATVGAGLGLIGGAVARAQVGVDDRETHP
jgi:hypothetical protein